MESIREELARVEKLVARDPTLLQRPGVSEHLATLRAQQAKNPLLFFVPHKPSEDGRQPQREFIEARTPVVAAFAGNRFGKSTGLTVCGLRESLGEDRLPPWLAATKRFPGPTAGWILCPTEDKIFDSFQPAFEKWTPPSEFKGGSWGKAFKGDRMMLSFQNGSTIHFKTYKQDPSTLGGAALHWVGYDEPPPRKHREECRMRLADYGGFEMFAMTPLEANTGYVRREIWKKRESPEITVVKGSIHDNPTLDKATVKLILGDLSDLWRQAREFGDFVNVGGLVYPDFERCVLAPDDPRLVERDGRWTFDPEFIRTLDVVCSIDPGIRNAGFSWVAFDHDLTGFLFEEGLLQDKIASDYVAFIREQNQRWGLNPDRISYVIDPAAKQRAQANGMTVLSEINKLGVYPNLGQNDLQLGIGQMRARMQLRRLLVGPNCVLHRDQADDYAGKEPEEGQDDSHLVPIEVGAHCLAALRYAVMERFWDPVMEEQAPDRNLGAFDLGKAPPAGRLRVPQEIHPMGSMF
jgi:hypothetical protein